MSRFGLLAFTDHLPAPDLAAIALELEAWGYDSLWIPEMFGREPFATAGYLAARTTRIGIATGIANVYARDAVAAAQARQTLAERSGGRFTLGLGSVPEELAGGSLTTLDVPRLRARIEIAWIHRKGAFLGPAAQRLIALLERRGALRASAPRAPSPARGAARRSGGRRGSRPRSSPTRR